MALLLSFEIDNLRIKYITIMYYWGEKFSGLSRFNNQSFSLLGNITSNRWIEETRSANRFLNIG